MKTIKCECGSYVTCKPNEVNRVFDVKAMQMFWFCNECGQSYYKKVKKPIEIK